MKLDALFRRAVAAALFLTTQTASFAAETQPEITVAIPTLKVVAETRGAARVAKKPCYHIRLRVEAEREETIRITPGSANLILSSGRSHSDVNLRITGLTGGGMTTIRELRNNEYQMQVVTKSGVSATAKNSGTARFEVVPAKRGGKAGAIAGEWITLENRDSSFEVRMPAGIPVLLDFVWPAPSEASKIKIDGFLEIDLKSVSVTTK